MWIKHVLQCSRVEKIEMNNVDIFQVNLCDEQVTFSEHGFREPAFISVHLPLEKAMPEPGLSCTTSSNFHVEIARRSLELAI